MHRGKEILLIKAILSVLIWAFAGIMTILVFLSVLFLGILLFPFDRKRKFIHAQGFWWADAIIGLNPFWGFSMRGLEHVNPHRAYVMVVNHQSLADIVMLYKTNMQFKWVAKESLFKIPIFGWCMSRMKYIKLARGEYGSIKKVYKEAGEWLKKGVSVLFFPEGTRSVTGQMNNFKNGAFKLAIKEKKPILPIYIEGSRDIITKGSWIFKTKASCRLTILPEINTEQLQPKDFAFLRDRVHERLAAAAQ